MIGEKKGSFPKWMQVTSVVRARYRRPITKPGHSAGAATRHGSFQSACDPWHGRRQPNYGSGTSPPEVTCGGTSRPHPFITPKGKPVDFLERLPPEPSRQNTQSPRDPPNISAAPGNPSPGTINGITNNNARERESFPMFPAPTGRV